jgi:tetratricopeptide (TPR) repeat protein
MKKVFAIIAAVALAFALAMGDQILKAVSQNGEIGWQSVKSLFSTSKEQTATVPETPKLPAITTIEKPEATNLTYDDRVLKGDYYLNKGFLTFAINEYVEASNLEPQNYTPYLKLTQANYQLGDYEKAEADAEKVLELSPGKTEAIFYQLLIAIKQSQFDKALAFIDTLSQSGISDARLPYYKALIFIVQGNHKDARDLLNTAKADPSATQDLKDNIDKMLAGYDEFDFAQGADDLYLGELLARGLNQIGEYELAIAKLKDILKNRADLRDAWNLLGFAYLNLNNYIFAATAFEQSYKLDPQLPATQYFLATTYAEIGRKDDAIVYLNYAISNGFEPKIVAERKLADLYLDKGDYDKSVAAYEDILTLSKDDVNAYVRPIWIYLEFLNQPEKAMKLGEASVIAFPDNAMAYNLLGWAQTGTQNYVEAEKNLQKSIVMDPTQAAPYYNLGKLYEATQETGKAKDAYLKSYQLDQNGSIGNLAAKRYNILMVQQ